MKRRAVPPNPAHPDSLAPPSQRGAPEFTQVLERDEAERLDAAKRTLAEEAERLRVTLNEKEKELMGLRKDLGT